MMEFETEATTGERDAAMAAVITIRIPSKSVHAKLPSLLYSVDGITYVEEL